MAKLNYAIPRPKAEERDTADIAKKGMSKQAVVNQAIVNTVPTNPTGGVTSSPQATGFGRTR